MNLTRWIDRLFGRSVRNAGEEQQAHAPRIAREEVRKEDSERRAKREFVRIEPPHRSIIEKIDLVKCAQ